MWILSTLLFRVRTRVKKRWLFQPESSLCADKLIICFTLSEQRVSLSSLPDHMHFITWHLDDKGNLKLKVNLEMTQGFDFLSVTQAWKSHWSWIEAICDTVEKQPGLCMEPNTFSRRWFASRLGRVIFKFVLLFIFKFHPDSPVRISMDGVTV